MKRFSVTWGGETAEVSAANESDAWAAFCEGHALASVHPNRHPRTVTEIQCVPPPIPTPKAAPKSATKDK